MRCCLLSTLFVVGCAAAAFMLFSVEMAEGCCRKPVFVANVAGEWLEVNKDDPRVPEGCYPQGRCNAFCCNCDGGCQRWAYGEQRCLFGCGGRAKRGAAGGDFLDAVLAPRVYRTNEQRQQLIVDERDDRVKM